MHKTQIAVFKGHFKDIYMTVHDYRKSSIKPPGGLFFSSTFEGGLIERGSYLI